MPTRVSLTLLTFLLLPHGCWTPWSGHAQRLKYSAEGSAPQVIALYEAWFGHPRHISVGYSSHDPDVIKNQIHRAKQMGISAFVVDWYGDREPFIDKSYALMQTTADKNKFKVAMMYDETDAEEGATDEAIADFTMFHETYLAANAPGHRAYLTYQGHPVIFIFPKGGHTDWNKVRAVVNKWDPAPLLIQENLPGRQPEAFDGYYAWIEGWAPDGSNWGQQYLNSFYKTMLAKHSDKIVVGGAWAFFDDSKATWGLNRRISARCGQTFSDTFDYWRKIFLPDNPPPFIMIETWNDYEEGSAVEPGLPKCDASSSIAAQAKSAAETAAPQ